MAENAQSTTTRKRPRKTASGAAQQVDPATNGSSKARAKALYHVYSEDESGDTLSRLGQYKGRNASEAIEAFSEAGGTVDGVTFVVVPDRNLARVKADVETKTKVKLSAV